MMTYPEAVERIGANWVEWLLGMDSNLIAKVLENQIGFAIVCESPNLQEAFEVIRENCS